MLTLLYRNSRLLALTVILILVWGISSYLALPRLEDPELVSRNAVIKTFIGGADAKRVEALITNKIEEKLTEIEEIDNYQSTSSAGSSIISVELEDSTEKEEVEKVWAQVLNKIDQVKPELPSEASEPELEKIKVKAFALITSIIWQQDNDPNYSILNRQAEVLKERLSNISGTEEVELFGLQPEEVLVELNQGAIALYNLSVSDISHQIEQSDSKVSAGRISSNQSNLAIEVAGELDTVDRVKNIPLISSDGAKLIRLQDVATVTKGVVAPANELSVISDRPGVTLAVHVDPEARLNVWIEDANKILDEYGDQLPQGIKLKTIIDQSNYVSERINNLILNLLFGGALVFIVTTVMMGWRSATIVGICLPLCILMVFGWMNVMSIPLHQMSITGLIVALGILIDNAIVMVDEVNERLRRGLKPIGAIKSSISYLFVPLFSSTITTVLAFLPIALLPGPTGEFVSTIAISVILAVCSSFLLAMLVMPTLTVKLYKQETIYQQYWWQTGISLPSLTRWYKKTIKWSTARPVLGICLALFLPLMGFLNVGSLRQQFFPAADRDQLQIQLELPAATAIAQTQEITKKVRKSLLKFENIRDVHWFIGRSVPRFYYNIAGDREQESNYAQAIVQLDSFATSNLAKDIQALLDRSFPTARILVRQLEQGPPFDAPVEMRIYGSNLNQLKRLGEKARNILLEVDNITHTRASLAEVIPQIKIELDEEEVVLAGLDRRAIASQIQSNFTGATGGSILEANQELPVRVRLSDSQRASNINSLNLLPNFNRSDGEMTDISLSSLGRTSLKPELAQITRYNGKRVNVVQGFLTPGILPEEALSNFEEKLKEANWQLPGGYSFEFGGEEEEKEDALSGLVSTIGVLVIMMIATLVLSLNSFRLAAVIGVVAIASFGLGLFSIWLFDYPFGFNPIVGTVGLIGVAINDSIVVLSAIGQHSEAKKGNKKAIREVVLKSTRHVVTTTLTTAVGFVPLLLVGGEFWPPLAVAIAGGVIGATFLALYLIPAAYLVVIPGKGKRLAYLPCAEPLETS
ncbi:efflux RND transporter permease subunit [Waterburya agarophytonicola K14]|uniref:Efflux RND transporter permease subunit n=1 Tax=Waterburya agarophytonicola KI4 TaxID=2874699 RepID=A0A964BNC2_9CYAN|nr:efflux RND transporter permease subunit [Waterburya agarophytonicola]MCC0175867.1 efflux RND transporter permease subunit [Waterburya agarophytonicola KI4]